ncbi:MAG: 3'-5' exonuclease [Rhodocyclaceae bacterium]|nr:MAG: 3'-5' exonuclease [Rhodocyclaceae bacterium]
MSAAARTLFDLGGPGPAAPTKAPARKAPVRRAQIALPHVPGRAPWEGRERELGFPPSRPVGVVTGPSAEAWARFTADRARSLELGAEARALPYEPNEYRLEEQLAREAEKREAQAAEARQAAWRASQMGSISARVFANEPAQRELSMPSTLAGAEQQPLWTEGAVSPPAADLLWLDTETTGLLLGTHQVIELACLRTDRAGANARDGYSTLVLLEPWSMVDRRALAVSGLNPHSPAFRASARPMREVLGELARRCEGAELAGHNVSFDRRMLAAHYEQCGLDVPEALRESAPVTDTQPLAREARKRGRIATKSVALGAVATALGITAGAAHRAAGDVGTALRVFRALKKLEAARAA